MEYRDVALFPLDTVLFPQMVLPLHIFEPRYRQMISECVRDNTPFGVVLIEEGSQVGEPAKPYLVGTLAKITEVIKLDDGRMYVTTVGTERFRLLNYRNIKPYMTGDLQTWPETGQSASFQLIREVQADFKSYLDVLSELAHKRIEGLEMPNDAAGLSYIIPNWLLQIELDEKQRLLEMSDCTDRLLEESKLLRRETEFLRRIKEQAEQEGTSNETGSETEGFGSRPGYISSFPFSKN